MAVGIFRAKDVAFLVGQAGIVFRSQDVINANLIGALPADGYASGMLIGVALLVDGPTTLSFADIGSVDLKPDALVMAVSA